MRYLTRKTVVEAIQWDGKEDTFGEIREMVGDEYEVSVLDEVEGILQIDTSTGSAWPMKTGENGQGDWIVWDGEYAHCYKYEQFWEFFRQEIPEIIVREATHVSLHSTLEQAHQNTKGSFA
jgi:hypothetical protein